jgi:cellobiose phosphorylase
MEREIKFLYCHFFLDNTKGVIKTQKIPLDNLSIHIIELKQIIAKVLEKTKESTTPMFKVLSLSKTLISPSLTDTAKLCNFFINKDDIFCQVELNITPIKKTTQITTDDNDLLKFKSLTTYSFWEANKQIVKVRVPLKGVNELPKENIKATFTESSIDVRVYNLNGMNYHFGVPRLDAKIVPEKSEAITDKDGNIIVRLRKAKEDDHWSYLYKQKYVGEN